MNKVLVSLLILSFLFSCAYAIRVKGYYEKSTDKYVMPHNKTSPDSQKWNNYSTKGNVNPFTGKKGTKRNY